jgi:hypothetical protein
MAKVDITDIPVYEEADPYEALPPIDPDRFSGRDSTRIGKAKFLTAFRRTRVRAHACKMAGVRRQLTYSWEKDDPEFKEAMKESMEDHRDVMESELVDRGIRGVLTPKFDRAGEIVCFWRDKSRASSDLLLESVTAENPGKWKHRIEAGEMKQLMAEFRQEIQRLGGKVVDAESVKVLDEPVKISDSWEGEEPRLLPGPEESDESTQGEAG